MFKIIKIILSISYTSSNGLTLALINTAVKPRNIISDQKLSRELALFEKLKDSHYHKLRSDLRIN